jgi:CheY-like chemotaxis protein
MSHSPRPILIVEDNVDDLFLLKRAFRLAGISNQLCYAEDGQRAIDYLQGTGPFGDRDAYPLPALVLLDLKLPTKHGFEVLAWIRQQPSFKRVIIVVLTSSGEENDISRAYDLGANAYLVKPTSAEKLTEIIRALDIFWLCHNKYSLLLST